MLNQHQTIKDNIEKYNKANPLADFLIPLIGDKKEVLILDVGSGAYSVIGSHLDGVNVNIIHCDNQDFTKFYKKYSVKPYATIYEADMEELSFKDNTYDIVTCINALDHTKDAYKAVEEMIRVCMPNGYIYIDCHLDQMTTGHKHFWNAQKDGTFINNQEIFNLKNFGFEIEFIDNGEEDRYNRIVAILKK